MLNKITFPKKLSLFLLLLISFYTYSQDRTCGMVEYMEEQMKDPVFAEEYELNQEKFKDRLKQVLATENIGERRGGIIVIPVAVHFPTASEADRDCLVALAQNQIDILNADYSASNADLSQWTAASANYPGVNVGAPNISFCLATTNHPVGVDPELIEGEPAVTIGYNYAGGSGFPETDSNWSGYMNFLVKDIGGLGYSPLGGSISAGQPVVLALNAFGSGPGCPGSSIVPGAPYNLGRTVTHELGHFYNLNHTFNGDGDGVCGTGGDGIADTPEVANSTYGCPSAGSVDGCIVGQKALTMDYMDYTNDACMYLFTEGQATVVDAYITGVLQSQIKPDVCGPPEPGFTITGTGSARSCPSASAVFNFTYTPQGGFTEETAFTATGQPSGSTVIFSPSSLDVVGNFTMTVSDLGAASLGDYTITVTGTSTTVTKSKDVVLSIVDSACPSVANTTFGTGTQGVIFNTISNLNTGKPSGYSDYTAMSTNINRDSAYDITVNIDSDGPYQTITYVWIDWNQNCSFDDAGELYNLGTNPGNSDNVPSANSPLSITIPAGAELGNTTMRVTTKYTSPGANQFPTSCENNHDAEVEDYTVNILASLSVKESEFDNFAIFPNPNQGEFTIKLNSISGKDINVGVFDIRGRSIFNKSYSNTYDFNQNINLKNAQSGMYLVTIGDGLKKTTRKIIIE